MRNSEPLTVLYEISEEAKSLSEELGCRWELEQREHFDNIFYLRVVTKEPISINPNELIPISTGIYLQVTEPHYQILVTPYMNLLRRRSLGIISNRYDNRFTNEVRLLMYNYSSSIKILNPGEIVGLLAITPITQVVTQKVAQVSKVKNRKKDNSWIQQDKRRSENKSFLRSTYSSKSPQPYNQDLINKIVENRLK